jgi:hypothetical protein
MELQRMATVLVVLAVLVGSARMLWFAWRRSPRPRAWRIALLLLLQLASAALLYRTLWPPAVALGTDTLVVATANSADTLTLASNERLVVLPEAGNLREAEAVPDLATALRRHPEAARLRIVGRGLTARDRDSVRGLPYTFVAAPLPRGLVELPGWVRAQAGADFQVRGRVNGVAGGRVELLDPSGQRVDRQPLAADGRFSVTGATRTAGLVDFRLRVADAHDETVEEAALPVEVFAPAATRVLVLAGAPEAEVKYLRRWALDSGVHLTTQIQLGGGLQLGDAPVAFNAATLKGFDAVIVDERAWDALGDARRRVLVDAARNGLGLLVRVGGPLSAGARNALASFGLRAANAAVPPTFALPAQETDEFTATRLGPGSLDAPTASTVVASEPPELTRQPLRIDTANAHAWLRDNAGRTLAAWRPLGRGRVGMWLPMDTFQLVLLGRDDLHAQLWSQAVAEVARPAAAATLAAPADGRQGVRMALCGLAPNATVAALGAQPQALLVDPATGNARCAGFWPQAAGWHVLRSANASAAFHVRSPQELPGIAAREDREATQRLALLPPRSATSIAMAPGARWPWFLAWLLVSAALWWFERSRFGRVLT